MRSKTCSFTTSGRQLGLSTLLTTTMGFLPSESAFCSTKRVCGMVPSKASTSSSTPSHMLSTRSTSPPKSAWPGVSMMLILQSLYLTDTFLDRMVIPRSRSRSLLSMMRSPVLVSERSRCPATIILSTRVVFPWSTWAIIAMLRSFCIVIEINRAKLIINRENVLFLLYYSRSCHYELRYKNQGSQRSAGRLRR